MKPLLKYMFAALLFLFCFSSALAPVSAQEAYVPAIYEILATVTRVSVPDNEIAVYTQYGEVSLRVTEHSLFYLEGYDSTLISFFRFAEVFAYRREFGTTASIEFSLYGEEYIVVSAVFVSSE